MTLADSNVWLALALSRHPFHGASKEWFGPQGTGKTLFCRTTQQSFLRLLTNKVILAEYGLPPISNKAAWSTCEGFLADKRVAWAEEPKGLDPIWKKLSGEARASTKLWTDAYLAAFAISGGYRLVTADRGFKQFKNLDLILLESSGR